MAATSPPPNTYGFRTWPKDLGVAIVFLLAIGINQVVLLLVQRTRPYDALTSHLIISPSADPSFPSDHASAAFAIAFSFLLLGWRKQGLAYTAAAVLIALSRVYVGIHYVGDVIGGAMTALLAALIIHLSFRPVSALSRSLGRIL